MFLTCNRQRFKCCDNKCEKMAGKTTKQEVWYDVVFIGQPTMRYDSDLLKPEKNLPRPVMTSAEADLN